MDTDNKKNVIPIYQGKRCKKWKAYQLGLLGQGALTDQDKDGLHKHWDECEYCKRQVIDELENGLRIVTRQLSQPASRDLIPLDPPTIDITAERVDDSSTTISCDDKHVADWSEFVTRCEQIALRSIKRVYVSKGLASAFTEEKCAELLKGFFAYLTENSKENLCDLPLRESVAVMRHVHIVAQQFALNTVGVEDYDSTDVDVELTLEDVKVLNGEVWRKTKLAIVNNFAATIITSRSAGSSAQQKEGVVKPEEKQLPAQTEEKVQQSTQRSTQQLIPPIPKKSFWRQYVLPFGLAASIYLMGNCSMYFYHWRSSVQLKQVTQQQSSTTNSDSDIHRDTPNIYPVKLRPVFKEQLDPNFLALAERFRTAADRLEVNSSDVDALLEITECLEKLLLPERAKAYCETFLAANPNLPRRAKVKARRDRLDQKLHAKLVLPFTDYDRLTQYREKIITALLEGDVVTAQKTLDRMAALAREMQAKTGEEFGLLMEGDYQWLKDKFVSGVVTQQDISNLQYAHDLIKEVDVQALTKDVELGLKKASAAKEVFQGLRLESDTLIADLHITRYLNRLNKNDAAKTLIEQRLAFTINKYLLFNALFTCADGENISKKGDLQFSLGVIESGIQAGKQVGMLHLFVRPLVHVINTYFAREDNVKIINEGYGVLGHLLTTGNHALAILVLQDMAMAAFSLGYPELFDEFMQQSIELAIAQKEQAYLVNSYFYLGLIRAKQGRFQESREAFANGHEKLPTITDPHIATSVDFHLVAYQARSVYIEGNFEDSIKFYTHALALMPKLNYQNKTFIAWLYQGRGQALRAQNDCKRAKEDMETAVKYDREAKEKAEKINTLLSVADISKTCEEDLAVARACVKDD
ncbi:MAG: hypothetical protein AB1489_21385 [Acidobacteriota bacterium]